MNILYFHYFIYQKYPLQLYQVYKDDLEVISLIQRHIIKAGCPWRSAGKKLLSLVDVNRVKLIWECSFNLKSELLAVRTRLVPDSRFNIS